MDGSKSGDAEDLRQEDSISRGHGQSRSQEMEPSEGDLRQVCVGQDGVNPSHEPAGGELSKFVGGWNFSPTVSSSCDADDRQPAEHLLGQDEKCHGWD